LKRDKDRQANQSVDYYKVQVEREQALKDLMDQYEI